MTKGGIIAVFFLYLVFGMYFIMSAFNFITIPDIILQFDNWIGLVGGVLILIGGINYFRARKKSVY